MHIKYEQQQHPGNWAFLDSQAWAELSHSPAAATQRMDPPTGWGKVLTAHQPLLVFATQCQAHGVHGAAWHGWPSWDPWSTAHSSVVAGKVVSTACTRRIVGHIGHIIFFGFQLTVP